MIAVKTRSFITSRVFDHYTHKGLHHSTDAIESVPLRNYENVMTIRHFVKYLPKQ